MKYCLIRILGNDLPPRHSDTQTYDNLKYILENEPHFLDCTKGFVLNRIVDEYKTAKITELIEKHELTWWQIPFTIDEYKRLTTTGQRIHYLTNVNAARNNAIDIGLAVAEYVLPLDGGNFFVQDAWDQFNTIVRANTGEAYFLLGQARVDSYDKLGDHPQLGEPYHFPGGQTVVGMRELTIAFGHGYDQKYNEDLPYAKADKVELLWRLGIPGVWDRWEPQLQRKAMENRSKYYKKVRMAGWVHRLPSGNVEADNNNLKRGDARLKGLMKLVEQVNFLCGRTTRK